LRAFYKTKFYPSTPNVIPAKAEIQLNGKWLIKKQLSLVQFIVELDPRLREDDKKRGGNDSKAYGNLSFNYINCREATLLE